MTDRDILQEVEFVLVNGGCGPAGERIIRETPLAVRLNGRHHATAMITAGMEKEYAAGLLYTQGLISRAADITSLEVHGTTVDVEASVHDPAPGDNPVVVSDLTVTHRQIFNCVRDILQSPVFSETEAVHSAGLFLEGKEPVAVTEDIGRHHALDKVIGAGLLKGVDFRRAVAASTGRQPTEMIIKCRNAGIPVIATKGVPTTLAIDLARKCGITIAGFVRGKSMLIYSHPERIK